VPFSSLSHLECSRTGDRYDADQVQGVSEVGAPLLARYDLEQVRATVTREEIASRPQDLWRYHEVLPVRDPAHVTTLGEGMTPLLPLPTYGAAIGIPGFLEHAGANVSFLNETMVREAQRNIGVDYNRGMVMGFSGLSIFTFLFVTPTGLLTLYLLGSGSVRMAGAWFDDPVGDPLLTGLDFALIGGRDRHRRDSEQRARQSLEGPEVADRAVSASAAGLPGCDLVIVASRRKPGWENGVTVFTADAAYRIGPPVEKMIAGRLRTLYPLTAHEDFEAVRKSVYYELPDRRLSS